jgi:C4-dicarboxylate-specific signal transduction histidine kinase
MERELHFKTREVMLLNSSLEKLVEERTADLQASLQQLSKSLAELKAMQNKLVEQEKLASLGTLVAGVAHEINTPIGVAITAASHLDESSSHLLKGFLSGQLTKGVFRESIDDMRETTAMILKNLERAAELVRSFKMVAVDQSNEEKREFNLQDYLNTIVMSLRPQIKRTRHEVVLEVPDNISLYSYPGAYSQIFTNLIMNSLIHGFKGVEQGTIRIVARREGEHLKIDYFDNGHGIAAEIRDKIFDPFVTTSRHDGGSGLGTHILYNLVTQALKGSIESLYDTEQGVHFALDIPIV